ncbi:MAG: tRNA (guanosine(37)-N1)-methyltransferase TrmD [Firmicutes bacterium]|nr:tRNA (guanosine(37)-N1)-methyltransferase TrmD [Bacillota bacterium]
MKIDILTLFPNMFEGFINESIIKRAINNNYVEINVHNIRDYTDDPHNKVDDYQFGGGEGMVLMPQPIFTAVRSLKQEHSLVVLMTPQGQKYNQEYAHQLLNYNHIIIICGHYEGFDERIRSLVDMEISIGDFVLTGGELPSMVICDSVIRLLDGVIKKESYQNDSFENNLLDYPVYTKPVDFEGMQVPEVLLSGHHENIRKWRLEEQIKRTKERRPDLLEKR